MPKHLSLMKLAAVAFAKASLALAIALPAAGEAPASGADIPKWKRPLENLGDNIWDSHFSSRAVPFYLAAGAATFALSESGTDANIQRWAAGHKSGFSSAWSMPGWVGGFAAPVLVPGGMLFSDDQQMQDAGAAAMQASAIALGSSLLLKALTNRRSPEDGEKATDDESRNFRFGFLRQSAFGGFPSSHAATNMAMSAALAACYRDRPAIRAAAYGWAGYVAVAAALGDQGGIHWTSDVVAGSAIGWIIGDTVGRNCGKKTRGKEGFSLSPDLENNGLVFTLHF